jgi:hypothetical protein
MQYKVLLEMQHDGSQVKPGDMLDLTEQQAAELLRRGLVESPHKPFDGDNLSLKINLGN